MAKQDFLKGLEAAIKKAASEIKPLLLHELKRVQLPLLEVGVYNKKYQQEGIQSISGNHWHGEWEVPPSKGLAEEKPGVIIDSHDHSCIQGYIVLAPDGIFHMEEEPFFDDPRKRDTSDLPSWNTRKEVPLHYLTYAKGAFEIVNYLRLSKNQPIREGYMV